MGFDNPPIPWAELERKLSGRRPAAARPGDGGDSPAWSRRAGRIRGASAPQPPTGDRVPFAELHCHSTFSFLDGASHPEELAEEAARLGLDALALTDHDGFYGMVRFAEAAKEVGVPHGVRRRADPRADRAAERRRRSGGRAPARAGPRPRGLRPAVAAISAAQVGGRHEGPPGLRRSTSWPARHGDHWLVLTGCRKGAVPAALARGGAAGTDAARGALDELVEPVRPRQRRGRAVATTATRVDGARNDALAELAAAPRAGRRRHQQRALRHAPARAGSPPRWPRCARAAASTRWTAGCRPAPTAHLRSGAEMAAPVRPLPRRRRAGRRARAGVRVRPAPGGAAACRTVTAPGPRRDELAARADRSPGRVRRYGQPAAERVPRGLRPDRARAGHHRAARLPRLLPDRVGHRRLLPAERHPLPGPRLGRQLRRLLRARHHQRRPGARSGCCSSGSSPRSATARPTSTSTSSRAGARRSSSTSTSGTGATTPPRSPTSSPTGPKSAVRDMAKALGYAAGPAGRVVQADRPLVRRPPRPSSTSSRPRHPRPTCWSWPPS